MLHYGELEVVSKPADKQKNSLTNQLVAISKKLTRTQSKWNPEQKKLFVMCLTKIRWSEPGNSNVIMLKKSEILEVLGISLDENHKSFYLRDAFKKLKKNSEISWTDPEDKEIWGEDDLITSTRGTRDSIKVTINPDYMPLLENLVANTPYITIWSNDIFSFKSRFAFALFEELRTHCDTSKVNWRSYTTQQLRELFELAPDAYIRKKDGKFDRPSFEKYVLDKAIEEINKGEMITIHPFVGGSKGKHYQKKKSCGYVSEYLFKYTIKTQQVPNDEQIAAGVQDYQLEQQAKAERVPANFSETGKMKVRKAQLFVKAQNGTLTDDEKEEYEILKKFFDAQ